MSAGEKTELIGVNFTLEQKYTAVLIFADFGTAARDVPTVNQCEALYIINRRLEMISFNKKSSRMI